MSVKSRFLAAASEDVESVEYLAEMQFLAIAEKICAAMEMRGFTRSKLASAMGVSPSFVTKLLSGEENLSLLTMTKVSKALGVNLSVELTGFPDASAFTAATAAIATEEIEDDLAFAAAA